MIQKFLLFAACSLAALSTFANHIAGGDFTVRHLQGNNFEAKLVLYRDCEGNMVMDNLINIAVYDAVTNSAMTNLNFAMSSPVIDTIHLGNSFFETGLCVSSITYSQVITLPDHPNGYYMS